MQRKGVYLGDSDDLCIGADKSHKGDPKKRMRGFGDLVTSKRPIFVIFLLM